MIRDISINNISFKVDDKGYEYFWDKINSWEKETFKFLKSNIFKDQVFVECGAWIGPITLVAARSGMVVYSFEPDPVAFEILEKNISLNTFKFKPKIFNFGLSNFEGKKYLFSNNNNFGKSESSLISYKNLNFENKVEVNFKIFDKELYKIQKLDKHKKIKLLKIDIEGGEFLIESQIYKFIKKNKITCMLSYHHFVFNYSKIKKNFYKLRTILFQLFIKRLDNKSIFKISSFFKKS